MSMLSHARALIGAAITSVAASFGTPITLAPTFAHTVKPATAGIRSARGSVSRDKRAAMKRRNQLRHKRAVRG